MRIVDWHVDLVSCTVSDGVHLGTLPPIDDVPFGGRFCAKPRFFFIVKQMCGLVLPTLLFNFCFRKLSDRFCAREKESCPPGMPRGNKAVPVAATSIPEEVVALSQPSHTDPQAPFVDETPYQRFLRRNPQLLVVPGSTLSGYPEPLRASTSAIPTSYFARRAARASPFGGRSSYSRPFTPYRRATYSRSYSRPTYRRSYTRRY